jgi:putative hydrolase of the HAD superfamily
MKNEIRGIFFDLGGVLVEIDKYYEALLKTEQTVFRVSAEKLRRVVRKEIVKIEQGKESPVAFWRRVSRRVRVDSPPTKILKSLFSAPFKKHARINRRTLAIVKQIRRSKRYSLGIISNTSDDHVAVMNKWKLFEYFDVVVLSNEIGFVKPQKEIFLHASRKIGIEPGQLLFIDDKSEWLVGARKCGFRTVHFKSPAQLEKQLRGLGVKV